MNSHPTPILHRLRQRLVSHARLGLIVSTFAALALPSQLSAQSISFPAPTSFQTWAGTDLASGDVNGDGKIDLVSVKLPSANLYVAYNTGNGTYSEQVLFGGGGVRKAILVDVNADGKLDIVSIGKGPFLGTGEGITVYLNNGTGGFSHSFSYSTLDFTYFVGSQFNTYQPLSIEAGKTTASGKVDLVVSSIKGFPILVFRGNGDGSFQASPTQIPNPTASTYGTRNLKLADLDGDGDQDLVASGGYGSYYVKVWQNDGSGNFALTFTAPIVSSNSINTTPLDLALIDMNKDGKTDLVVGTVDYNLGASATTNILTFRNTGDLTSFPVTTAFSGTSEYYNNNSGLWVTGGIFQHFAAKDLDSDGYVDLVTTAPEGLPTILRNKGDGTFASVWTAAKSSATVASAHVDRVFLVDITGSGVPTLLGGKGQQSAGNQGIVYGNVKVVPPLSFPAPASFQSWAGTDLASGDVNGDGKIDLVSVKLPSANLYVAYNTGNGTYSEQVLFGGGGVRKAILVDVNADGKLDIVSIGKGPFLGTGEGITVYLNNGTGGFSHSFSYSTLDFTYFVGSQFNTYQPLSIEAGKTTASGKVDLVVSSIKGFPILVFRGNGDGSFQASPTQIPNPTASTYGTRNLKLADLDGDGDQDLVASGGYGSYYVKVWQNDGSGNFALTFTAPIVSSNSINTTPLDLALIDMNKDGKTDLVVGTVDYNLGASATTNILTFRNTGDLTSFPVTTAFSGTSEYYNNNSGLWVTGGIFQHFAAKDLDSDGYVDLVTTAPEGLPTILRNKGDGTFASVWTAAKSSATVASAHVDRVFLVDINGSGLPTLLGGKGQQSGGNRGIVYGALQGATAVDTTAPVIAELADLILEATSSSGAVVTFTATANDDIDGAVNVVASPASGSTFALGNTIVGLAAADRAGNTATASFSIQVRDTTAPTIATPANITANATSAAGAIVTFAATATDRVSTPTLTYSPASGATFPIGTTTVTVTAKDAAGNTATSTFSVTVQGAAQQLANLLQAVNALNVSGPGSASVKNQLDASLSAAEKSIDKGNVNAAQGQLGAFLNKLDSEVASGKLTPAQAQPLVDAAKRILSVLS